MGVRRVVRGEEQCNDHMSALLLGQCTFHACQNYDGCGGGFDRKFFFFS